MSLKSKDCLEYLEKELKKELIGPSNGLFNRVQYKKDKKVDGKDKNYATYDVASLSYFPNDPNLNKQEILVNSPKFSLSPSFSASSTNFLVKFTRSFGSIRNPDFSFTIMSLTPPTLVEITGRPLA